MEKKVFVLILVCLLFAGSNAVAKVSGQCADCHTMHSMQDGTALADGNGRALTKGDCIGCHTGSNGTAGGMGNTPFVTSTTPPLYGPDYGADGTLINKDGVPGATLAGGTFYYVAQGNAHSKGHNVKGLGGSDNPDTNITPANVPPGWIYEWGNSGIATGTDANNWTTNQLTCAGTYGCHGGHEHADDFADISGAHHGDDSEIDGTSTVKSFRFLKGIIGYEDADWEYSRSNTDHNQYYGAAHTTKSQVNAERTLGNAGVGQGISTFCGTCHGNFHSGSADDLIIYGSDDGAIGSAPWLRHPTDYALATAVTSGALEYSDYSGMDGAVGQYNVIAPVATSNLTGNVVAAGNVVTTSVTSSPETSIVNCLSCHRAHGSPYDDLLRWNYADIQAGQVDNKWANKGCFACHTTKD